MSFQSYKQLLCSKALCFLLFLLVVVAAGKIAITIEYYLYIEHHKSIYYFKIKQVNKCGLPLLSLLNVFSPI